MATRHLRPTLPARSRAGLVLFVALIGMGGCLEEAPAAEPYVPPRLSAEALADSVSAILAVVYSPHSTDWYDMVLPAVAPIRNARQERDAAPSLLAALEDDDPVVRHHAVFILAKFADRRWTDQPLHIASALTAALADDDPRVREIAARSVAHVLTDRETEEVLIPASRDPSSRVRWAVVVGLAYWGRTDATDTSLLEALDDPDPRTRYAAAFAVNRVFSASPARGEAIADRLIARMAGDDVADSHVAAQQLGLSGLRTGERHLPALMALARSTDHIVRRQAASEITQHLLRQRREGALDHDLLAALLAVNRADLADDDAEVRVSAAWSLRRIGEIDATALPDVEAALAVETDYETHRVLRYVRATLADQDPDYSDPPGWVYARDLCLPHESFSIMGMRPYDDELKVRDALGEPTEIIAGTSEDDGGMHIVLNYDYGTLEVEIARTYAQRIATRSTTVPGGGLSVGATRQDALAVLGVAPNPDALAALRYIVTDCDTMGEATLSLDFGEDGRIAEIAIESYGP